MHSVRDFENDLEEWKKNLQLIEHGVESELFR